MKPRPLDRIDQKILDVLQQDGRITNQALAEQVGLSPSPCLARVRRLEADGVIRGYRAVVDTGDIKPVVKVFATATLTRHDPEVFRAFESAVLVLPEIVECAKVSGSVDYVLRFECESVGRYHAVSDQLLKLVPGAVQISSFIVLDDTKTGLHIPR